MSNNMNATLSVKFPNQTFKFPVEWVDEHFTNGAEVAMSIFFGDDPNMEANFEDGYPELSVTLNADPKIKSQAFFESEAGEIFPNKRL